MLKSKQAMVPGGFSFYQPEMDWALPNPGFTGFEDAVTKIQKIRESNPRFKLPTDRATISADLDNYTEKRLRDIYGAGAEQWLVGGAATASPENFTWAPKRSARGGAAVNAEVKKTVAGIGLLTEWLGNGLKPVDSATANARALICAACPLNQKPSVLQKAYGLVADGLHLLMNARADLKLSTPYDDKLETCTACDCRLTLKVFTPAAHIKANTSAAVAADLAPACWIRPLLQ